MRPLVLVLLLLTACHGSPTEPRPDRTGALSGRVTFVESGTAAAGARVVAHLIPPGVHESTTVADAAGNYLLPDLIGGSYAVSVFTPAGELAFLKLIDLGPASTVLNFEISGQRCVTISGRVTDGTTHAPVAGAVISFLNQSATSDASGFYTLSLGCPPFNDGANHLWSVEHPNYKPLQFPRPVSTWSTTNDIVLQPL
jgi:hypothetical protein